MTYLDLLKKCVNEKMVDIEIIMGVTCPKDFFEYLRIMKDTRHYPKASKKCMVEKKSCFNCWNEEIYNKGDKL